MTIRQLSISEFLAASAGSDSFEAKLMPIGRGLPVQPEPPSLKVGMLFICDGRQAFVIFNTFVGVRPCAPGEYPDEVWETVFLAVPVQVFADIPVGLSTYSLEWSGKRMGWNSVEVEQLARDGAPVIFAVTGVVAYSTAFVGGTCEFLIGMDLQTPGGEWVLERSASPSAYLLSPRAAEAP